ncbi:hypothetical protein SAMN04488697_107226 [Pseudomonas sp. 43mfcvi1.1]|nr:hypothetical protein ATJ40_107226 [Pseudomonas sp. 43mfcvi1.1]SSB97320.1 hypothetical protein SAMN04488697_107226 [Pseudomonas sp. 43mfcvi1.1]
MTAAPGILELERFLWRGDLSPLGCVAAPLVSAAHSSGDKSPRHNSLAVSCIQRLEAWSGGR